MLLIEICIKITNKMCYILCIKTKYLIKIEIHSLFKENIIEYCFIIAFRRILIRKIVNVMEKESKNGYKIEAVIFAFSKKKRIFYKKYG